MSRWIKNWFSNFVPFDVPFVYDGITYLTPENFYQAMKISRETKDFQAIRQRIASVGPGASKKLVRQYPFDDDWWKTRENEVMLTALRHKFKADTQQGQRLLETGDTKIIELTNWHDNKWGDCVCTRCQNKPGENRLGKMLMQIRDEISPS